MAQLMPLPLTVSCFCKIQIGFTFLVPAHLGSPGHGPLNGIVVVVVHEHKLDLKKVVTCFTKPLNKNQICRNSMMVPDCDINEQVISLLYSTELCKPIIKKFC